MNQPPLSILVVGGGLAGMSAAIAASRTGATVKLLERASEPGGRATTSSRHGFLFNIGPHALYSGAEAILDELGVRVTGAHPPLDNTIAWLERRRYVLPMDSGPLDTELLAEPDKLEASSIFASLAQLDTAPLQDVTVRDWLEGTVKSQTVRTFLQAMFRVSSYANAPELASAGAHLDHLRTVSQRGVRYIDGGWQTIVDGLRARALDAGARIQASARVASVSPDAQAWRVRTTAGDELRADAVILAVSPAEAAAIAGGSSRELVRWAERAVPVQAATLDVALSSTPRPSSNYSIGIDRPLYFSVHSVAARLAPDGGGVLHAAMYLAPDARPDPAAVLAELEWLVDEVQPGWRDLVVHRRYLPHITVTNAFVTAAQGGLPGRAGPAVPDAPGLFVAGDWVGPVGMLAEAALASGLAAGELAARVSARVAA